MKCPRCNANDDRVVDSRESADGAVVRRRRECLKCFLRFTTYEKIETTPLRVVKKSGERVRFDRERVLSGMIRACEKLSVSLTDLEAAAARVEARSREEFDREVESAVVGQLVMEELRTLDHVAYVRFASVYREFTDVSQFVDELRSILAHEQQHGAPNGRLASSGAPSAPVRKADGDGEADR